MVADQKSLLPPGLHIYFLHVSYLKLYHHLCLLTPTYRNILNLSKQRNHKYMLPEAFSIV